MNTILTLLPPGKLGEFRRKAIGLTSERALLVAEGYFVGDLPAAPFWMRSGSI